MVTVTIKNVEFVAGGSGSVAIDVEYTNGVVVVQKRYATGSAQGNTWLADQIIKEYNRLTAIETYFGTITVGPYTPGTMSPAAVAKAEYESKLTLFRQLKTAISMGIITDQNTDYVTTKAWLTTNFSLTYADLFNA